MRPHNPNSNRPNLWRCINLSLLLAAFAIRLQALSLQDIWWDEARNIDVALRPFLGIPTAPELDIHPPLYFWLLHVWGRLMELGNSVLINPTRLNPPAVIAFSTRYLSVFAGTLSVALLYRLTKISAPRFSNRSAAAHFAMTIGVLSPFWLAESQETRMYTVGFALLSAAAIALNSAIHTTGKPFNNKSAIQSPIPQLSFFAILAASTLLVHYNAVFILVAWFAWWLIWSLLQGKARWQNIHKLLLTGIGLTLLVLPLAPIALRQIPGYENPNLTIPSWQSYLAQNWQAYLGGYAFTPQLFGKEFGALGVQWLWVVALFCTIGLFIIIAQAAPTINTPNTSLTFLLVWLLGGLALYYIAVLDRGAFNPRYSSFITPALYALIGIALAGLYKLWKPLALLAFALIIVGIIPALRADLYDNRFAREDMHSTSAWLRKNSGQNDLILVDQKYPFGFYYQRYASDPAQQPDGAEKADARYLFVDANTVDQTLTDWAASAERIFYVRWFESDTDPRRTVTFLLDSHGTRINKEQFRGYSVTGWELNPPNKFELANGLVDATHVYQPAVEVIALSLPAAPITAGRDIPIVLRWRRIPTGFVDRPLKARVAIHALGSDSILGQDDRPLLNDRHLRTPEWTLDDRPLNVYEVPTPDDLAAGEYEIRLIIYDAETLEAKTYFDIAGNPAGIEAPLGQVTVVVP